MIEAERFVQAARRRGFGLYTGVPCSYLTPFINYTIKTPELRYVGAAQEGEAVAIAAGATLGGLPSVVMFQNSGLGNAVNPLTSLTYTFRLPVLVIVTWRGEPGGAADEPQHELMGAITPRLLELMDIPWSFFPVEDTAVDPVLDLAMTHLQTAHRPFALLMRKGSVAPASLGVAAAAATTARPEPKDLMPPPARSQRHEMLKAIQAAAGKQDIVVATTGFTGRELYALGDLANQLYMVGSMGCAASLGLGLAIAQPTRRVIVIDGDGAALMHLGGMSALGAELPPNLVHVLLDNGQHESTGGQATVSAGISFCGLAASAGYPLVSTIADPAELETSLMNRTPGLRFIHVPVVPGVMANLPRPAMAPADVAARFRGWLASSAV
ncbi:MAG: phosphonopyruvate decarboxylase [Gammaproteobacteria bacterium]